MMLGTACITCGIPHPRVSRCPKHGRQHPNRHRYQVAYDYAYKMRKQARIKAGERCAWAYKGGCRGPLQMDHIIPLSLGGQSKPENERILCRRHNVMKGGRNRVKHPKIQ